MLLELSRSFYRVISWLISCILERSREYCATRKSEWWQVCLGKACLQSIPSSHHVCSNCKFMIFILLAHRIGGHSRQDHTKIVQIDNSPGILVIHTQVALFRTWLCTETRDVRAIHGPPTSNSRCRSVPVWYSFPDACMHVSRQARFDRNRSPEKEDPQRKDHRCHAHEP